MFSFLNPSQWTLPFGQWKRIDSDLYRRGRSHIFENVGIRRAFDTTSLFRRFSALTGLAQLNEFVNQFKLTDIVDGVLGCFGSRR